jgi:hypothetical protein
MEFIKLVLNYKIDDVYIYALHYNSINPFTTDKDIYIQNIYSYLYIKLNPSDILLLTRNIIYFKIII